MQIPVFSQLGFFAVLASKLNFSEPKMNEQSVVHVIGQLSGVNAGCFEWPCHDLLSDTRKLSNTLILFL